jgi:hypothetical protein
MAAKDVAPAVTLMSINDGRHQGGGGVLPAATKLMSGNGHSSSSSSRKTTSTTPPPAVTLSSGHRMPAVGLGVWRMEKTAVRGLIHAAIRNGYRHFDCAGIYACMHACMHMHPSIVFVCPGRRSYRRRLVGDGMI